MTEHLTDAKYWDGVWGRGASPKPLDPRDTSLDNFAKRRWHLYFQDTFRQIGAIGNRRPQKLIEVGCGGSIVLPYLGSEFGLDLAGLDYSPAGCRLSDAIHAAAKIPADIRQGDMFEPPNDFVGKFDIVYSRGLVEHFRPTEIALNALAKLCRPGGYLVTAIPNFAGFLGSIQKYVNRPIYRLHVPLSARDLRAAHIDCGLEVLDCRYLFTVNFSVVNFSGREAIISESLGLRLAAGLTKTIWLLQEYGLPEMPSKTLSPYIVCLAKKTAS
jgi:SAM-dependent methyltransferase